MEHQLVVNTETLDQIEKALLQAQSANTRRKRRIDASSGGRTTKASRDTLAERKLINEALAQINEAQDNTWAEPDGENGDP